MQEWNPEIPPGWCHYLMILRPGGTQVVGKPKEIDGDSLLTGQIGTMVGMTIITSEPYETFVPRTAYSLWHRRNANGKYRVEARVSVHGDDGHRTYIYEFRSLRTARLHFKRHGCVYQRYW